MDATAEVRGTLYQVHRVPRSPGGEEQNLCFRWVDGSGTFKELMALIGAPGYELQLDSRWPAECRPAEPGWLVFGKRWPESEKDQAEVLGVFVPEYAEARVAHSLASDLGEVIFFPMTLATVQSMVGPSFAVSGR